MQRLAELPGVHGRGADIACLAGLDDVVERFEVSSIGVV